MTTPTTPPDPYGAGTTPPAGGAYPPPPPAQPGWQAPPAAPTAPPTGAGSPPPAAPAWSGSPAAGRTSFDPKSINQLDWGILGAGFLAFIFSFFGYYSYSSSGIHLGNLNAWHGFFGWFAVLVAVAGSALVALEYFAPQVKLPLPIPVRLAVAGAYALSTLCMLLALVVVPNPGGYGGFNKGHSFGYWISLVVIIAGLVLSVLRLKQTGGKLPWEK